MTSANKILRAMFSRSWWWTTILVLLGVILTIRLGFWQLDRLSQRRIHNDQIKNMQAAPPLILNAGEVPGDLTGMEYRAIQASGSYDYEHQLVIRNQVWTQEWGDETGYALLTPLVLENGQAILVQRGWIPAKYNTPASWREFDETSPVSVEGIIRLPMKEGQMGGGVPDPTIEPGVTLQDFWNFVNIEQIQRQTPYPLLGVYIQQSPNPANTSIPYRSLPELDLSDGTHLGYALQWFFFAGLLLFGYPVFIKKQLDRQI